MMNVSLLPIAALLAPGASPAGAPDIRTIVPPQPYFIQAISIFWPLLAAVILALVALVLWLILRRPKGDSKIPLTPKQEALQRLRELETRMDTLDARTFGGAVADVLRIYVGAQYGLHPERQTSPEFLASISGSRAFSTVEHALLTEFLESCDLLKFARADATLEGKRRLLDQAANFLEDSAEKPPPLPSPHGLTLGA